MMKALLLIRFRALWAGLTAQGKRRNKGGKGTAALFAVLYLYVGVVLCGGVSFLFKQLAEPYHAAGLDWLYFAMAGMMGLAFAVIGSVFTTQSQLYDAKDNDLLLSMPVRPWMILLSRMLPLLALNLLFAGIIMVPAAVIYAVFVECAVSNLLLQLMSVLVVTVLAQAIACLLGWLLHLLLSRMNKSAASMLYMVAFLGLYFWIYSQAGNILNAMAGSGQAIASVLQSWVWPLYALGQGCLGNVLLLLAFTGIGAAAFGLVYWLLSVTFLHTATLRRGGKKRKLQLGRIRAGSASSALVYKEMRHFLGSPVYLTNMGIGIVLTAALVVAGLIFRQKLMLWLEVPELSALIVPLKPLLITAILSFTVSSICISTPSVSLEGKSLWILKSLPVSARQIVTAKLHFHCYLATPITVAAGLVLAAAYGCDLLDIALCGLVPGLLTVFCGLLGLLCGLKWAKMDWLSEAYPCKQSVSVLVAMFGTMGLPVVLGVLYLALADVLQPVVYLALCAVLLVFICLGLYRALMTWGLRRWSSL